jgi:hypothetical protein
MLSMFWYALYLLVSFLLDILHVVQQPLNEKDLAILAILFLRQQLAVIRRRQKRGPTLSRLEKLLFATLAAKLKRTQ